MPSYTIQYTSYSLLHSPPMGAYILYIDDDLVLYNRIVYTYATIGAIHPYLYGTPKEYKGAPLWSVCLIQV